MFQVIKGIPENKAGLGLVTYALCSDGTYLIRSAGCGHIVTKVNGIEGLPEGKESISTLPRKIPVSMFWETHRFFKYVESHFGDEMVEAYVLIMYNPREDRYFLHVPNQIVGPASAHYNVEEVWSQFPGCKILFDFHSHTSKMGAFFSSTDNRDDNRDRYSGVIGKINNVIPDVKVRFNTLGKHYEVDMNDLFCTDGETSSINDADAIKRVRFVDDKPKCGSNPKGFAVGGWSGFGIPRSGYAGLWNRVRDRLGD